MTKADNYSSNKDEKDLYKEVFETTPIQTKETTSKSTVNTDKNKDDSKFTDTQKKWGFDLYPERKGEHTHSVSKVLLMQEGTEFNDHIKCIRNVQKVTSKSPLLKLMMSALKGSGCPIDLARHVSCEVCDEKVIGGYDPSLNQIVVCQNMCRSESKVTTALAHEMVHMFDLCKNKLDFKSYEHLACTEIRAANLTSCSFLTKQFMPMVDIFKVQAAHQDCVRARAIDSIAICRKISREEVATIVDKVFFKCYNDLEPIGRRPRRNSYDFDKAYKERLYYGYY